MQNELWFIPKNFILSLDIITTMTIPTYDYDQRHWKKIYGPEELNKIGELLTGIPASEITFSSNNNKPTVRIRRKTKSSDSEYYLPVG
jgi:hypothetical protein